jgi:hypothetical protein
LPRAFSRPENRLQGLADLVEQFDGGPPGMVARVSPEVAAIIWLDCPACTDQVDEEVDGAGAGEEAQQRDEQQPGEVELGHRSC